MFTNVSALRCAFSFSEAAWFVLGVAIPALSRAGIDCSHTRWGREACWADQSEPGADVWV